MSDTYVPVEFAMPTALLMSKPHRFLYEIDCI